MIPKLLEHVFLILNNLKKKNRNTFEWTKYSKEINRLNELNHQNNDPGALAKHGK